ncbi:hypothetical protein D9M71_560610 [compost metagenome]
MIARLQAWEGDAGVRYVGQVDRQHVVDALPGEICQLEDAAHVLAAIPEDSVEFLIREVTVSLLFSVRLDADTWVAVDLAPFQSMGEDDPQHGQRPVGHVRRGGHVLLDLRDMARQDVTRLELGQHGLELLAGDPVLRHGVGRSGRGDVLEHAIDQPGHALVRRGIGHPGVGQQGAGIILPEVRPLPVLDVVVGRPPLVHAGRQMPVFLPWAHSASYPVSRNCGPFFAGFPPSLCSTTCSNTFGTPSPPSM